VKTKASRYRRTAPQKLRAQSFLLIVAMVLLMLSARSTTFAASGTWDLSPGSGDWNTGTNWSSATVPNGASDIATFDISNTTAVGISANTTVAGITFNSGASAFTITVEGNQDLFFQGAGITNNSGITQNFVAANVAGLAGDIFFESASSTAGSMTHFTDTGSSTMGSINSGTFFDGASSTAGSATFVQTGGTALNGFGGFVQFEGALSTAGTGTFINQAGAGGGGGFTEFDGTATMAATAANATITNNGGATLGAYGLTIFTTISTAANATITNTGGTASGADGGQTDFFNSSTAGSATITSNAGTVAGAIGGSTQFSDTSTAGSATLIANGGSGAGGSIQFFSNSTGGTARVEVFNNGTGTAGNLDISSHNAPGVTIGSLEGSGKVFLGARNLTVGSNNMSTTFSGVIQDGGIGGGTGGSLTKIGAGTLSLTNSNTYTGGTLINAGTLVAGHDGALGTGNVSLIAAGVVLTLQNGVTNNYIADNATISIVSGATANLNFTGASDLVGGIVLNGFNETTPGTYGSATSGAMFESVFFSGTGTLLLVPEPSTWTMMGLGVAMLAVLMRFRRRRN
jgi:autotransporter-associated beta strand protein